MRAHQIRSYGGLRVGKIGVQVEAPDETGRVHLSELREPMNAREPQERLMLILIAVSTVHVLVVAIVQRCS